MLHFYWLLTGCFWPVVMGRWHVPVPFPQWYPMSWPPIKQVIKKTPLSQEQSANNNLPAESPVLIQSGLAMLAMAKMSAARKRHPDITVSLSMTAHAGGVFLCLWSGEGRGVGHLGETDLSPFLLSHHRGDRDGVCLSHDQSAHRVWSQAVRWAGCSPQIGAFHYFSNSRDLLAGPSPAQEERLAARAHGLLRCGCIPVEWVENFTAIFCFNSRLIPKQWSRIHACSALISWVCMEPPLSLPPCRSFFFSLDSHRRKAPPMLASKRFSGAPNLHPHMRNFAI